MNDNIRVMYIILHVSAKAGTSTHYLSEFTIIMHLIFLEIK